MAATRIIFFGTPEFAVASLERLVKNKANIVAVVTSADKPAGRGQQIRTSAVKDFALQHNLKILQPVNLKAEAFLNELKELKPDLQIVVAFRMLPEEVWKLPKSGTFNLHASLLPQYRGAAPINWALINGEKETGVTTFFLRHEIDTGSIINQEKVLIGDDESLESLYQSLMMTGAGLVVKTVHDIETGNYKLTEQEKITNRELKTAPKLNRKNTKINLNNNPYQIRNFIRGLTPEPGAHAEFILPANFLTLMIKIFSVDVELAEHHKPIGTIETDQKNYLKVYVKDGKISIREIQVSGKNKMNIKDFLNGFKFEGNWVMG